MYFLKGFGTNHNVFSQLHKENDISGQPLSTILEVYSRFSRGRFLRQVFRVSSKKDSKNI
jgi:hypothetical protein